ncbi:phosphate ABC transporter permease subunit PstC [Mongoliimonas terrestris]|uniref:phosphate ABC transporter permease subunit PstC n=1 Tax=Mongoliimonas terrestris TaxID=1709001 RepID=UPI0009499869|nr:phosphate ABC transporter permease subunit PstC [Mongoliimonas terrestris]
MIGYAFLLIIAVTLVGFWMGRAKGASFITAGGPKVHSLPGYHGAYVAAWVGVPAFILVLIWVSLQSQVVESMVLGGLPESMTAGASTAQMSLYLSEIKNVASGRMFSEPSPEIVEAAATLTRLDVIADWALVVVLLALMVAALTFTRNQLSARFRSRNNFERVVSGLMIFCSTLAILTTAGIVASLVYEAAAFFRLVPITEFLFGLKWEPQIALRPDQIAGAGAFGAVPVFAGTLLISLIAMAVATPIGLFTAIYLVEYAGDGVRAVVKPIMEILAGVPTVVFGFFAILVVAPAVREAGGLVGIPISPNSAFAAGAVMGIMILPFISSLSDDALKAVPRSMRDGSLALGATPGETITKVLLPAALPGIVGGILLGVSRAIGETMIVVMAAGLIASLTFNPLDSVTTVTVQIVTLLIGDTEFDSPKTLAAFALGLVLFLITLVLNIVALRIVRKYREQYE